MFPQYPNLNGAPAGPREKTPEEVVASVVDSCVFKGTMAGVGGLVLGTLFGLMLTGMEDPHRHVLDPNAPQPKAREVMREMAKRSYSTGKNFAVIGAMFSVTECAYESMRGKNDHYNTMFAACTVGGTLGLRGA